MNDSSQRPEIAGTPEEAYNLAHAPVQARRPPLFQFLGTVCAKGAYKRFAIETHCGEARLFRAGDLANVATLLEIYPDANYWRARFPRGQSKVDSKMAAVWFIRECQKVGPYEPPEHLRPRPGRPREVTASQRGSLNFNPDEPDTPLV